MSNSSIDKAIKIVKEASNNYRPAYNIYYVVQGIDEDDLQEHPCSENYCEKCINSAVIEKKKQFFLERTIEMGKIYEYERFGFYREPRYRWNKKGELIGLIIRKIKSKASKEKVVKCLKAKLNKQYPLNMIFSSRYTSCGETDDFDSCESCGIIFEQGLLLSSGELQHWETNVTDEDLKKYINEPRYAYQLERILSIYWYEEIGRIKNLAKRIIKVFNETKK